MTIFAWHVLLYGAYDVYIILCTNVYPLPLLLIVVAQNWVLSYHCLSMQLRFQSSS
jgi:hypothetical protein